MKFLKNENLEHRFLDQRVRTVRVLLNASDRNVIRMQIQKGDVWVDATREEILDVEDRFYYDEEGVRETPEEFGFSRTNLSPKWKNGDPIETP